MSIYSQIHSFLVITAFQTPCKKEGYETRHMPSGVGSAPLRCWEPVLRAVLDCPRPGQRGSGTGALPRPDPVRPLPADPSPVPSSSSTYHAIIGGIVAFIVFLLLILLIFLGHYLIRHKGQRGRPGAQRSEAGVTGGGWVGRRPGAGCGTGLWGLSRRLGA